MKKYKVVNAIKHGTTKATDDKPSGDLKLYAPDEMIDLDEVHAEPLLASGDIVGPLPVAPGAKK